MDARDSGMPARRWIGRGRGVLGLSSQQTSQSDRRPGHCREFQGASLMGQNDRSFDTSKMTERLQQQQQQQQPVHQPAAADKTEWQHRATHQEDRNGRSNSRVPKAQMQNGVAGDNKTTAKTLLAKYSYKANPASPLGFSELDIKQGQKLTLVERHPTNEYWWKVQDETGSVGYVPASYMMIQEAKPSTLPWLANREKEPDTPAQKPIWKPYVSAYSKPAEKTEESKEPSNDYYCSVCDKRLNGPKPYGAHMASKAHKEEVEMARERGEDV